MAVITSQLLLKCDLSPEDGHKLQRLIHTLGCGLYATTKDERAFHEAIAARETLLKELGPQSSSLDAITDSDFSTETINNQTLTIMFAGVDTLSATLAWAIMQTPRDMAPTLRLRHALVEHPPVYFIPRAAVRATNVNGTVIEKGAMVYIMISELHNQYSLNQDKSYFVPFGVGTKRCPAEVFSWLVGETILDTLERIGYSLTGGSNQRGFIPDEHPAESPYITLQSDPRSGLRIQRKVQ
ncbi:MAG: cytochrome P450 [Nocardioides sp.]